MILEKTIRIPPFQKYNNQKSRGETVIKKTVGTLQWELTFP